VAQEYATRLSMIAFATAVIQGLATGAAFEPALKHALSALALFFGLGLVVGELARRIVEDRWQASRNTDENSIPQSPSPAA
jgi:hypothetical protein